MDLKIETNGGKLKVTSDSKDLAMKLRDVNGNEVILQLPFSEVELYQIE